MKLVVPLRIARTATISLPRATSSARREHRRAAAHRPRVAELAAVVAAELLQRGEGDRERRLVDADHVLAGAEGRLQPLEGGPGRLHRRGRRLDQELRLALGDDVDLAGVADPVGGHRADGALLFLGLQQQRGVEARGRSRRPSSRSRRRTRARGRAWSRARPLLLDELDDRLADDAEAGEEDLHPSSTFRIASSVGWTWCIFTGRLRHRVGVP